MIYEHPLAYLLGVEGIALLRSFTGEYDRAFVDSRITEIRRLLDDQFLANAGVDVECVSTVEGYRVWSTTYDDTPNAAFDLDQPVVMEIIDTLPAGVALDAACGTGRYAAALVERGHQVLGVDSSPDMLAHARQRVPQADFRLGDLHSLPVADSSVDLVVCALALTHVPVLEPVMAEFARVLRPAGDLVIADMHQEAIARGSIPKVRGEKGQPGRLTAYWHLVGDYLRAALPAGLQLRRCEEPRRSTIEQSPPSEKPMTPTMPDPVDPWETVDPWELWPWCLDGLVPEAARAASAGTPAMIIWHFQLNES